MGYTITCPTAKVYFQLMGWANEENNRKKASRIARVADRIRKRESDYYKRGYEAAKIAGKWA